MKDVGIRIKNLREQKGMTQKNLADRANITVATLSPVSYTHLDVYKRQPWELSAPTQPDHMISARYM